MNQYKVSKQYYYKFGEEVIATSSQYNLNINDYIEKCFGDDSETLISLNRNDIVVGGKKFKIKTMSPNFKDHLHYTEKEMSRKINTVRYDTNNSKVNFDYIIGVYDAGDEYLSVIFPAEIINEQAEYRREVVFLTQLDDIINSFLSAKPVTIPFRSKKPETSVPDYNLLSFRNDEILDYFKGKITEQEIRNREVIISDKRTWMKPKEIFSRPIIRKDTKEQIGALGEFIFKTIYEMNNKDINLEWNYLKGDKYAKWDLTDDVNEKYFEVKTTTIGSDWRQLSTRERIFFEENIEDYFFAFVDIDNVVYNELVHSMKEHDDWEISKSEIVKLNLQNKIQISVIAGVDAKEKIEFIEDGWLIRIK